jgi:hypothetical protein
LITCSIKCSQTCTCYATSIPSLHCCPCTYVCASLHCSTWPQAQQDTQICNNMRKRTFQSFMVLSLVDKMCLAPLLLLTHFTCTHEAMQSSQLDDGIVSACDISTCCTLC